MLTDNVLLEIFDHYGESDDRYFYCVWQWQLLAHVSCPRWRQIISASPRRVVLQLLCKHETLVRKNLGIWPAIHIIMLYRSGIWPSDQDNVIAALEHPDRVCRITLSLATTSQLGKIAAAVLRQPFSVLTHFSISSWPDSGHAPVLPGGLLGGSAPFLQQFKLCSTLVPVSSATCVSFFGQ